jgi:hypothetical protein
LPQSKPAPGKSGQDNQGCQVAIAIGSLLMFAYNLSQCDFKQAATIDAEKPFGVASLSNQIEAIEPRAKVEPLAPHQIKRGLRHLRLVFAAEGLPGAMIYSQNCYDYVSQAFTWGALDRCGGFDLQAVTLAQQSSDADLNSELEFFGPETAAARYLAIAVKGGESAESADLRLEALQKQVSDAGAPVANAAVLTGATEGELDRRDDAETIPPSPTPQPDPQSMDRNWLDQMTGNAGS